jgi:hypothetical protein
VVFGHLCLPYKNFSGLAKRAPFKVSPFRAATILVLVAFDVLAACCCGTVAKRRPIFQPGKRGSDLLWRLGDMERRYESARGCRGSSSLYPLIVARREV